MGRRAKKVVAPILRGNYKEVSRSRGPRTINYGTAVNLPTQRSTGHQASSASDMPSAYDGNPEVNYSQFDTQLPTYEEVRRSYGKVYVTQVPRLKTT